MNVDIEIQSKKNDNENKPVTDPTNNNNLGRYYNLPTNRIVRVSRASGGKDRHSKVLTSKGLRDRRVRLSVYTAIQFYDLQDRLGYDQPSKAVEWLLNAASHSISELPQTQISYEKRSFPAELTSYQKQENSKGSALSLSRSENRIKARERAKERVMDKDKETKRMHHASSFTNGGLMFSVSSEQFSFLPEHYVNNGNMLSNDNNNNNNNNNNNQCNGSSSGINGLNRGTLQSNSSSFVQRFNNPDIDIDGSSQSFFTAQVENHHQFVPFERKRKELS